MDNYPQPLVSVIMPAYNTEKFIKHTLQSIISQTYRNLEIIVVDDGSTDSTPQIVSRIAETDSRIRLIQQPNQGAQYARLNAFKAATGEYIKSMDSDDILIEDAIERLVARAIETEADMVVAPFISCRVSASGEVVERTNSTIPDFEVITGAEYLSKICLHRAYWATWTTLYKRTLFTEHNIEIIPNTNPFEDVIFTTQLALYSTKVAAIKGFTVEYTMHSTSAWSTSRLKPEHLKAYRICPDWIEKFIKRIGCKESFEKELSSLRTRVLLDCIWKRHLTHIITDSKKVVRSLHKYPELEERLTDIEKKVIRAFRQSRLWGYFKVRRYIQQGRL